MIVFSLAVHAIALVYTLVDPGSWPWTLSAIVANHALLFALSLQPRNRVLGPNLSRLPDAAVRAGWVALTIDDGPDPDVTPVVLDILDAEGAKATFFCVGSLVARHPDLAREIARRGHSIENHSEHHRWHFAFSGLGRAEREIVAAQRSIAAVTGSEPMFFRSPAGIRGPMLDPALKRLGLTLAVWTHRAFDTVDGDPEVVLRRLTCKLAAGDILLLHDGHAARTADGVPVIVAVLPRLLAAIRAKGLSTVTLRAAVAAGESSRHEDSRSAIAVGQTAR